MPCFTWSSAQLNFGKERTSATLRDILKLIRVDGGGFLIFGLPSSEGGVHQSDKNGVHELYFICDDINAFIAEMKKHNVGCTGPADEGWGLLVQVTLPGGGKLGVYEPRHARPTA
jgi:hypothetical protein